MATFDWNDVELTNIIWDEDGGNDDHIVPYPNRNDEKCLVLFGDMTNKEMNMETSGVSSVEQKKPPINTDPQVKLANNSKYNIHDRSPRFGLDPWNDVSDASIIDVEKSDPDIIGSGESKDITTSLDGGFSTDDTPQYGKTSKYLQHPSEDVEKSDYVGYDWASIESFDDLDRIFSNDNSIFGDINVGYADESWSSCKDGNTCMSKLAPTSVHEKLHGNKSQAQDVQTPGIDEVSQVFPKQLDDCNAATVNAFPVKGNEQKRFMKDQKLKETSKKQMHDLCATRSTTQGMLENDQYAPSMLQTYQPLVLRQQKQVQRTESFQRNNFSGPLLASSLYGNMVYHYPSKSHLGLKFQPVEDNRILACANPKSLDATLNPPAMTPEEKIEKLRRQQQLRVILAIQKQHKQFGNPVSVENSTIDGGNAEFDENISGFPSLDQNSAIGHDDNNAVTMPLSICSMEESVIRQLQDSISRLDTKIRLSIRDSLFRLAKSARQRHCPSDTSTANITTTDEINKDHEGFTGIPDVETNTNPIDRIVAHLLFHTPLESAGELSETPHIPVSAMPFYERKPNSSTSSAHAHVPERSENPKVVVPHASKIPCSNVVKGQSMNERPYLDAALNASRDEATAGGHVNTEASTS